MGHVNYGPLYPIGDPAAEARIISYYGRQNYRDVMRWPSSDRRDFLDWMRKEKEQEAKAIEQAGKARK
jgi:hypothetical protein